MSSPSRCSIHSSRAYDPRASARSARSIFLATGQQGRAEASTTSQVHDISTTSSTREIQKKYDVIAVVSASKKPEREAYTVPAYMKEHGYMIVPVNPTADEILGEKAYKSLMDLPPDLAKKVDLVCRLLLEKKNIRRWSGPGHGPQRAQPPGRTPGP